MKSYNKILFIALTISLSAFADESSDYCQWLDGKARSQKAVLQWPTLLGSYSHRLQGSAVVDDQIYVSQGTLGLQFSPVNFYKGWLLSDLSKSECTRYSSGLKMDTVLKYGNHLDAGIGLSEEIKILKEAQVKATEMLSNYEKLFQDKVISLSDLYEIKSRVENLANALFTAENEKAKLEELPAMPKESLNSLVTSYLKSDEEVESTEASQRNASAWIFTLRGDAEKYVSTRNSTNFVATVNIGLNLGGLFQGGANSDAIEAKKRLAKKSASLSPAVRMINLRNTLSKNFEAEKKRLAEITALTQFLKGRISALKNADTLRSKKMADSYWLDSVRYEAQAAGLNSRIQAITAFLKSNTASP